MSGVVIFGNKSTTAIILETLSRLTRVAGVVTLSPEKAAFHQVADYMDLEPLCEKEGIPVIRVHRYDLKSDADREAIAKLDAVAAFCIGWQRLIPESILSLFPFGVFGMHGSADGLPLGRGRSPLNWSLIERRKQFFTSMFKYDAGVDSGNILDTFVFHIRETDTAEVLHFKNTLAMKWIIQRNLQRILAGDYTLEEQPNVRPTYYPKRTPEDSIIDFNADIFHIEAFIRAVTRPFNGAFSYIDKKKITIWCAAIFETGCVDFGFRGRPWGEIVQVFPNGKFLINCRGGLLIVHEYEYPKPVTEGMRLVSPETDLPRFPVNRYGYHDIPDEG